MNLSLAYRLTVLTMIVAVSGTSLGQAPPTSPATGSTLTHQKVVSRGVGKSIKVKEVDGKNVAGTITAIDADSFQVTPKQGAQAIRIRNDEVTKVENGGLRTGIKVTIIVLVVLVLVGGIAGTRV